MSVYEPGEIDAATTRVYRFRVIHPTDSVAQIAARAGIPATEAEAAERG